MTSTSMINSFPSSMTVKRSDADDDFCLTTGYKMYSSGKGACSAVCVCSLFLVGHIYAIWPTLPHACTL